MREREFSTLESPADHSRLHSSEAWAALAMAASSLSQNSLVPLLFSSAPHLRHAVRPNSTAWTEL